MGIVRFALRLPHTFYVLAALVLFLGTTAILSMPTDIFPEIDIPVVTVIWQYTGLSTPEMEQRVTTYSEYSLSSSVNGIRDIEAQTLNGISVQKVFFQPDVNLDLAIAQIVAGTNSIRALMPAGIQPPIVVQYNASSVPVLQIGLSSDTLNEQQLYDYGIYRLRQQLAPIHGVTLPTPAGGKYRQIMVDIDPLKLQAKGLTPLDVVNAVNAQNLTLPAGTAKIGDTQFSVRTNALPATIEDLNNIPVKFANGATVFVKDVGHVHDGSAVQQNVVRTDGRRSVLLSIIKNGNASTLAVVNGGQAGARCRRERRRLPACRSRSCSINRYSSKPRSRVCCTKAPSPARLTALMIVLFLGSWRSTLVVMISIPLSILSSLIVLYFLGDTINTMTLGGLALAVGILVDDSTVTIENTHRLLTEERMPLPAATLHGAAGIAVPTLVSTLAISCVFVSVVFLHGPAKYLFTPLGLAVVFAMLASYGLSRTLTPITIGLLLKGEQHGEEASAGWFARLHAEVRARLRNHAQRLHGCPRHAAATRIIVPLVAAIVLALGGTLFMFVGRDFFPIIDGGQIQLHVRAPAGTRIEKTEQIFQAIEDKIREVIPENERDLIVDNIGLPARSYNFAFSDGTAIGVNDGVILIALKEGHAPTADLRQQAAPSAAGRVPRRLFLLPARRHGDADPQFRHPGADRRAHRRLRPAEESAHRQGAAGDGSQRSPGSPMRICSRRSSAPEFFAQIDRARASQFGLTANSIALNLNISLSSSEQVSPNFWTDPKNGTPYLSRGADARIPRQLAQRAQEHAGDHVHRGEPQSGAGAAGQCRHASSAIRFRPMPTTPTSSRSTTVYANVQDRDLGVVSARHQQDRGRVSEAADAGQPHRGHRPDRQHELGVSRPRPSAFCSPRCSSIC